VHHADRIEVASVDDAGPGSLWTVNSLTLMTEMARGKS
jgi:hypothetical protein